ncbi:hypothetical protein F0170_02210 [Pseudomonas sp. MAFF 730085]|uniref:Response regulator n=1 Tax=Pseudomonas kitaguniensis TaxID=2607908 RepID=A0A5N7JND7_9PSED|nr:hypothetical protein [Pseudomonas kitaguniensis]MPQ82907.1 hypothetical protein [Pseudomonas kitaguniensis]
MKQDIFEFDRQLYSLLCEHFSKDFTTRQLRDAYAALLPPSSFRLADVRVYVYEQIRRLIRVGWVEMADQRQKRDQVFRVLEMPLRLQLVLVDGNFSVTVDSLDAPADEERETTSSVPSSKEGQDDRTRLQVMLKETRLDLLSSLGETERYNQLFEEIPHLKGRFEGVYLEARDRSSKLLGHVRAIEHTLKTISAA